jgi:hypothetical protein
LASPILTAPKKPNELALVEIRDGIFLASGKPQLQMPKGLHRIHLVAQDFDRMKFLAFSAGNFGAHADGHKLPHIRYFLCFFFSLHVDIQVFLFHEVVGLPMRRFDAPVFPA